MHANSDKAGAALKNLQIPRVLEYKWIALIIINIATFAVSFDTGLVTLILPNIARDFRADINVTIWIPMAKFIMMAAFMPVFGRLSDIKGRKRYFNLGIIAFVVGSLLTGIASSIYEMPFYRALTGIGSAILIVNTRSLIVDIFPANERGKALGWHLLTVYLGHTLGPALGGIITAYWGWRFLFLMLIPIALITLVLSQKTIRETVTNTGQKMDWIGSILLATALILVMIAVTFGPQREWTPLDIVITDFWIPIVNVFYETFIYISIPLVETLALGLIFLALFLVSQLKSKNPIIDLRLFIQNRQFSSTNLEAIFIYTAHYSIYVVVAFYLELVKLMDPFQTGLILAVFPLVAALVSPISGMFSDRYDRREVRILAAGVTALALFLLSRLSAGSSIAFLFAGLVILGVGIGLFSPVNTSECLTSVPPRKRSLANGVLGMMRYGGQTLSFALSAAVIGLYLPTHLFLEGGSVFVEQYIAGINQSLLLSAVIAVVAVLIALIVKPTKPIDDMTK
jgi:EmrB/QacA subfamily drug resistance transporter